MDEPKINPTALAREMGFRHRPGEGSGTLWNWERFFEALEARYWKNRVALTLEQEKLSA